MLDAKTAQAVIDAGLAGGASFVEVFVEQRDQQYISFLDRKVKDVTTGTDFGVGIRLLFGERALYGYSNSTSLEELLRITGLLARMESPFQGKISSKSLQTHRAVATPLTPTRGLNRDVPLEEKIALLAEIDRLTRETSAIQQVDVQTLQRMQEVRIFNSEGLDVGESRHYARLMAQAIAGDGSRTERASENPGGFSGWEYLRKIDPAEIATTIARRAVTNLQAAPCPAGKMPVIIDNGFGGVIFHEACGHLLETTSVEKKASVFHDKMGEMIAHSAVTAIDDGTIGDEWGTTAMDDEGMPTEKTVLIEKGRLKSFLVDKVGALKTGYQRTGSGRRQSYKFAPASRMRNTYIAPGEYKFSDLIQSVERGLYAKAMGGGSVVPGTGQFNFAVEEAYLIENGKIGKAVRGATLIGSGPEVLQRISMVADNFALRAGMCGSVSGSIPVTTGQAALKVDEILVGGQA